jgi:secreted PhoX family phosphatase
MAISRRAFNASLSGTAFAGILACATGSAAEAAGKPVGYGPLVDDEAGVLDLPQGFAASVISSRGDAMDDGEEVPDAADGMGAFAGRDGRVILVRNHELNASETKLGGSAFDRLPGGSALPGGTTTLVYNPASGKVESQYRSLAGTIRNCAGGVTPWRTWLTCEEDVTRAGGRAGEDHGWVFEVPAALRGRATPIPLKGMGRFNHEAAAVDPLTGIVYLTEDRADGLFYRFVPSAPGRLREGGRLQALGLVDGRDSSRNWTQKSFVAHRLAAVRWIDLTDTDSPEDDLRKRGYTNGALLFARAEGIHMGAGEMYFTCTSGGAARLGQVFRFRPAPDGGTLELFFESSSADQFHAGDNLTVAPNGHLFVCEDKPDGSFNFIRGITPAGGVYPFARLRMPTELAGVCFSPDGRTMFVNAYRPTRTFAISGPWTRGH